MELVKGKSVYYARYVGKLGIQETIVMKIRSIFEDNTVVLTNENVAYLLSEEQTANQIFDKKKEAKECLKRLEEEYIFGII